MPTEYWCKANATLHLVDDFEADIFLDETVPVVIVDIFVDVVGARQGLLGHVVVVVVIDDDLVVVDGDIVVVVGDIVVVDDIVGVDGDIAVGAAAS